MVAIKNMEMPASCIDCPFQMIGDEQDFQCIVADKEFCNIDVNRRQGWCPLEEVSEPPMVEVEHKHVADILNHIAFDICDHYCKYAEKYGEDESALDPYCENCVLLRLMM